MKYLGDYTEDYATLNFKFSTHKADGTPIALSGSPAISVYKANGTTQSTAGITLSVDFDSVTGLNNVLIDLSADAFYAVANDYQVVITAGTVDGISVVGTVIAEFSIENRFAETDVTKIGGSTQSATDLKDFADTGYDPSTHKVQGVVLADTITNYTGNTAQSGDAYGIVNNGTYGNSALETLVDDIETALVNGTYGLNALLTAINTRLATSGYTAPPSVVDIQSGLAKTTDITALNDFNPASDVVAHVTLVDTTTTNTDMRGTNSAMLAANYTAPDNSSITGIKAKTDQLVFTVANKVDATATVSTTGLATEAKQDTIISDIAGVITHGDSAWLTGGGMSGSNTVTINVHDGDGVNIVQSAVEIWDSAGTAFYEKKFSNSSGQSVFNMDAGTYTVKISKAGYSFTDTALVVTTSANVTYTMIAYVIPAPATSGLCRVYTYVFKPDGTAFSSVTSSATISLVDKNDNNFYAGTVIGVYSSTTGLLYFDIIQGAKALVSINEVGLNRNILVPTETTKKLDDLE